MAQEFIDVTFKNNLGNVQVHKTVFEWISRINVDEIEGVHIVDGSFKKGINCYIDKDSLVKIEVDVRINYGVNAERSSRLIQDKIVKAIQNMVDVHIDQVDVNVIGFQFN